MNFPDQQIECEFRRQVYLCGGISFDRMHQIIEEIATGGDSAEYFCWRCGMKARYDRGHICMPTEPAK